MSTPQISTVQDDSAEQAARRRLWRNRAFATGILVLMLATAIGTHFVPDPSFGVLFLRAAAEAGTVGGLADWFAVTALFRHPLGIPIPHTAILPRNKDRLGRALGRFIERNFLTNEALLQRLRNVDAGKRLARWLANPETAQMVSGAVVATIPAVVQTFDNRELRHFLNGTLGEQLRRADIAPALGHIVHILTASREADVLFDRTLSVAVGWLNDNRDRVSQLVEEKSRWWIPKAVDRRVATAIVASVLELLDDLQKPESEARHQFRDSLVKMTEQLLHSPEQRALINASKNRILDHPEIQAWLESIWSELGRLALKDSSSPSSTIKTVIAGAVTSMGEALSTDAAMQRLVDSALVRMTEYLISWRSEIGEFVAEVVESWDSKTLTQRLELAVGSDLQYIRINGTLVGALAGCLIFLLGRAIG